LLLRSRYGDPRDLHSFPTRRSSDLDETAPTTVSHPGDSDVNGYRNVGYFTQWGVYGRGFQLKKLQDSGAAQDLTHINYSFGNIQDRKSTRLNSSHVKISYAVFCLKK